MLVVLSYAAHHAGYFHAEIAPVEIKTRKGIELFSVDEHPRPDTTSETLAKLKPVFIKDAGVVTAGNASGIWYETFKLVMELLLLLLPARKPLNCTI